jgi:hypothetical protein
MADRLPPPEAHRIGKVRYENIARPQTFSPAPPETKRILLKSKKFVNASLRWNDLRSRDGKNADSNAGDSPEKKQVVQETRLHGEKAVIYSPVFTSPLAGGENFGQGSVGKAEKPKSGGRAPWALFYC